jgi:hypothetical protein
MLMTNTVMNPSQPSFKVREHQMDNLQILFGNLRIAALGDGKVLLPTVFEVVICICIGRNHSIGLLVYQPDKHATTELERIKKYGKNNTRT